MSDQDFITPHTDIHRVDLIQRLCKGTGLLGGKVVPHARFGASSAEDFGTLINLCFWLMPTIPAVEALKFAFGFETPYTKLMERRQHFADKTGLSLSTVIRLERTGAIILDDYVRRLTDMENPDLLVRGSFLGLAWLDGHAEEAGLDPKLTDQAVNAASDVMSDLTKLQMARASR